MCARALPFFLDFCLGRASSPLSACACVIKRVDFMRHNPAVFPCPAPPPLSYLFACRSPTLPVIPVVSDRSSTSKNKVLEVRPAPRWCCSLFCTGTISSPCEVHVLILARALSGPRTSGPPFLFFSLALILFFICHPLLRARSSLSQHDTARILGCTALP